MRGNKPEGGSAKRSGGSLQVRASRDGDRFHYVWAASRLLRLLDPATQLRQVTVEGTGTAPGEPEPDGSEVIDVMEYYGDPDAPFSKVVVTQLKHSTLHPDSPMGIPDVGAVLEKFAVLDSSSGRLRGDHPQAQIQFEIVTNRPIHLDVHEALASIASGEAARPESSAAEDLLGRVKVTREAAASLCRRVSVTGKVPSVAALRPSLDQKVVGFTADPDLRVSAQLIELVAKRAGTEASGPILLADVVAAFGARLDDLFPAPNLLEQAPIVVRESYSVLAHEIMAARSPVAVVSEGGVGKSTFARALPDLLQDRAVVVIYDCFGQGSYRRPDRPRHRHRDGLVQIASELAGHELGVPILPATGVQPEEYVKLFVERLTVAGQLLEQRSGRHLVVVVDAADNAAIAASENADGRSFARDLLRLGDGLPRNVHLAITCRPERLESLDPPAGVQELSLVAYSREETAAVVRIVFSDASDEDISEIHTRTSGSPRVVAAALEGTGSISECLRTLAGLPGGASSPLDSLLQLRVNDVFEHSGAGRPQLERVAQLLTLLRPSVPVSILATLSGCPVAGIRSFVADLGRGLVLDDDAVQFLDEPTETYFRSKHPAPAALAEHAVNTLRRLAATSNYAAASLPGVMWSAGLHDDLLQLAAGDDALPEDNEVERRQVEHLRVDFALKAAVRLGRADAVVELALRAGAARAGTERRLKVLRDHPDFAGESLDARLLDELLASRQLPADWPGSTLGAEAAMLAASSERLDSARSRSRLAVEALRAWAHAPHEPFERRNIEPAHLAHITLALLRTRGPQVATDYLSRWRPAQFVLQAASEVAHTLASRGEVDVMTAMVATTRHPGVILGVFGELQRLGIAVDAEVVGSAWGTLGDIRVPLISRDFNDRPAEDIAFRGASWLAAMAFRYGLAAASELSLRLEHTLPAGPPFGLGDRYGQGRLGLLLAIALRMELQDEPLTISHYRPPAVPVGKGKYDRSRSNDQDLQRHLEPTLPWLSGWAKFALGRLGPEDAGVLLRRYAARRFAQDGFSLELRLARQIAPQIAYGIPDASVAADFESLMAEASATTPVVAALDLIPPLRGDLRFESAVLRTASLARTAIEAGSDLADVKADWFIGIARGMYAYSAAEAMTYYQAAVEVASSAGDDTFQRWSAVVALTRAASGTTHAEAVRLANHVARAAELVHPALYDGFDEKQLTEALSRLGGSEVFRYLSQWRERCFGDLAWQLGGVALGESDLLAGAPLIGMVLAPFSSRLALSEALSQASDDGPIDSGVLQTANSLASRIGEGLDERFKVADPWLPRTAPRQAPSSRLGLTIDDAASGEDRAAAIDECRALIATLDLTKPEGVDAAIAAIDVARLFSVDLLLEPAAATPELARGAVLSCISESGSVPEYQKAGILNAALTWPRRSRAFVQALVSAVRRYVGHNGGAILEGNWSGLDLVGAATLLGTTEREIRFMALEHVSPEESFRDADSCYRLAGGVAQILQPVQAAAALSRALISLERDLGVEPSSPSSNGEPIPLEVAVGRFIWAALGDPRIETRWRAAHAVRTAAELDLTEVLRALSEATRERVPDGFTDPRFPFYSIYAAEWLLLAVERAGRTAADHVLPLVSAVAYLSDKYPDHANIQGLCRRIGVIAGIDPDDQPGTDWASLLQPPVDLPSWERPSAPKPFTQGAPKSEYRFGFDEDEELIAPLTESMQTEHRAVLVAASSLILDEWGWRGADALDQDPRRSASTYSEGETSSYRADVPKAEDLDYYLTRNAVLTIAGRLMRTVAPYRDPDTGHIAVLDWLRRFDLAREDRLWTSDLRSPVPTTLGVFLGRQAEDASSGGAIQETDYANALHPAAEWVTVRQSASYAEYERSAEVTILSALVGNEAKAALLRSLQTSKRYYAYQLPAANDEESEIIDPPFTLLGWIDVPYTEGGIDRHDPFAAYLQALLPQFSDSVMRALDLEVRSGTEWVREGGLELVCVGETWADMVQGREPTGSQGYRLRITTDALDEVLTSLDCSLVVDVRLRRRDRSWRDTELEENEGEGRDHDDFRVFTYRPSDGWSDFHGPLGTREGDRFGAG